MADETESEWTPNLPRVRELLSGLGHAQSHYPACRLCRQRAIRLDKFGLCSKKLTPHEEWRAAARADMKAGAR